MEKFNDLGEDDEDDVDAEIAFLLSEAPKPKKKADPIARMNRRHAVVALPNRVAVATLKTIDLLVEKGRHGSNRSEVIRYFITRGIDDLT